jgi:carboxymethylenebutenolidase
MVEIVTKSVTCAGGLPAFIAAPAGAEKVPVIVILHERYGLVQHTKDLAMRHAREGLVCIAADYFFKHPDQDALHNGDVGYDMTDPESLDYMTAALDEVAKVPQADMSRIACMGVCQTGRHPLVLAANRPIQAALVWYGAAQNREWEVNARYPVGLDELISKVNCPVLGMFGEKDHIISIDHVRKLRSVLEANRKTFHIEFIGGAPHGWLNDTMPGRYRKAQAEHAWAVQRAFLARVFDPATDKAMTVQSFRAEIGADYDFSKNVRLE